MGNKGENEKEKQKAKKRNKPKEKLTKIAKITFQVSHKPSSRSKSHQRVFKALMKRKTKVMKGLKPVEGSKLSRVRKVPFGTSDNAG